MTRPEVARHMVRGMDAVREFRRQRERLVQLQLAAVDPAASSSSPSRSRTHRCARLTCTRDQPAHELAANLRRAFSGIVTGNVKEAGIQAIEALGPYELAGDPAIMRLLDELLAAFVAQQRMNLPGSVYQPGLPPGRLSTRPDITLSRAAHCAGAGARVASQRSGCGDLPVNQFLRRA